MSLVADANGDRVSATEERGRCMNTTPRGHDVNHSPWRGSDELLAAFDAALDDLGLDEPGAIEEGEGVAVGDHQLPTAVQGLDATVVDNPLALLVGQVLGLSEGLGHLLGLLSELLLGSWGCSWGCCREQAATVVAVLLGQDRIEGLVDLNEGLLDPGGTELLVVVRDTGEAVAAGDEASFVSASDTCLQICFELVGELGDGHSMGCV